MGDTRPRSVFLEVQDLVMDLVEAGLPDDVWTTIDVAAVTEAEKIALRRMASALGIDPAGARPEGDRHLHAVT